MRIKNLTNSPYELMDEDGNRVVLPAGGEISGFKPHPMQMGLYRAIGYFNITEKEADQEDQPKRRGRPSKAQE